MEVRKQNAGNYLFAIANCRTLPMGVILKDVKILASGFTAEIVILNFL